MKEGMNNRRFRARRADSSRTVDRGCLRGSWRGLGDGWEGLRDCSEALGKMRDREHNKNEFEATTPLLWWCDRSSGKNRRLSSIFDSCWRNEVSNFCLRKFEEVVPFCEHYGPDVDINNINSLDNSGSNETMQKVLASIV